MAVAGALGIWLGTTPDDVLRDELRRLQFWSLEVRFFLLTALSVVCLPRLARALRLRRQDLILPIVASALAFALSTWAAPATNRIYYDEQIYQGVGQNLTDLGLAQMCNDGTVEYGTLQCRRGEYNKEPYGYAYLLSVFYRVVGVHERVAHALNILSITTLTWVVFLLATTLSQDARAGGFAALVAALMPEHVRWANTAASEPTAALACALAVLAALAFARDRSTPLLLWTMSATAFAIEVRPECLLVVPLVGVILLLYSPAEFFTRRFLAASLMGVALSALSVGHLVAVRHEPWGASGMLFSTAFLESNLQSNLWFYLADPRFPAMYSALALAGIASLRNRRATLLIATYFLLFWGVFLFFYAGSYNYGADDWFSLMTFPPIAVAAGIGASTLGDAMRRVWPMTSSAARTAAVGIALVAFSARYWPFVRAVGEEAWGARADVTFARDVAGDLPLNSMVLTHNPSMFHIWGRNAAQASLATTDDGYVTREFFPRYAGGVFFHWNFWCNVGDDAQRRFCDAALERYPHRLVREHRERDYRYAFYRLSLPAASHDSDRTSSASGGR